MLSKIEAELLRVSADAVAVSLDSHFEPKAGPLVKIELGEAHWHMLPQQFLDLLRELPAGGGEESVRRAIEAKGPFVWHGEEPEGSRDTSP